MAITIGKLINGPSSVGGSSLTAMQLAVLSHLSFNPVTDRLEADVSIETALNSFYLEGQYAISAGGNEIFYRNLSKETNHWAPTGFIKDQHLPENQGPSGVSKARSTIYATQLSFAALRGVITTTNAVTDYEGVTGPLAVNVSLWGTTVRVEEALAIGTVLKYEIWNGTDDTGVRLFYQEFLVETAIPSGSVVSMWWEHPANAFVNDVVYARMTVNDASLIPHVLKVAALDSDPAKHWNEIMFRTFEHAQLAVVNDVAEATGYSDWETAKTAYRASIHTKAGELILWTDGEWIEWGVAPVAPTVDITFAAQTLVTDVGFVDGASEPLLDDVWGAPVGAHQPVHTIEKTTTGFKLLAGVTYELSADLALTYTAAGIDFVIAWVETGTSAAIGVNTWSDSFIEGSTYHRRVTSILTPTADIEVMLYYTHLSGSGGVSIDATANEFKSIMWVRELK